MFAIRHRRTLSALFATTLAATCSLPFVSSNAHAAITATGDYTPTYNGTDDPWDLNGFSIRIGDTAVGSLTIDAGSDVSNSYAYLGYDLGSDGTATVTGEGSTWNTDGALSIGESGVGTLTIEQGGSVQATSATYIAHQIDSTGIATVTGPGSVLTNIYNLYVGFKGNGLLLIDDGGSVHNKYNDGYVGGGIGSDGTVTVRGPGSTWDEIRDLGIGRGTLNIENGGSVSNMEGTLGGGTGTSGSAVVTGTGSEWINSSNLYVGSWGDGSLRIENGGTVTNASGFITDHINSVGDATVSGTGSSWINLGNLYVGNAGTGTLSIENGGSVSSGNSTLGENAGSMGTATVTEPGSSWTSSGRLYVGSEGEGTLLIESGGVVSNTEGRIGSSAGSTGTITVTGPGSVWTNSSLLRVGYGGEGVLNIENGGEVNVGGTTFVSAGPDGTISSGSINFNNGTLNTGTLTAAGAELLGTGVINAEGLRTDVDLIFDQATGLQGQGFINDLPGQSITINLDMATNPGTQSLGVGHGGNGTLTITDGVAVSSTWSYLGFHGGAVGTASVTGPGSQWISTDRLYVGYSGDGTLTIENGASVSARDSRLAEEPGSTGFATVSGPGSTWINSGRMQVGFWGDATLVVEDGGAVSNDHSMIGYLPDSISSATVTGAGSSWNTGGNMTVGWFGTGTLSIDNGGEVSIGRDLAIGLDIAASGTVNLADGVLDLNGNNINGGDGTVQFNFTGGTLKNASTVSFSVTQQGGTLAPGGPIGETSITGAYALDAGTVGIDLGGVGNPHDMVTATGNIDLSMLGTTLDLSALGPMAAGTYTMIESIDGMLTGEFEQVTGIGFYAGLIDVGYTPNAVTITLNWEFVPGDLDADGFVGITDLNLLLTHWNRAVTPYDLGSADVDGDGFVGIEDLNAVLGHWNQGPPPMDMLANVPEPAVIVLMLLGVCDLMRRPHNQAE